MSDNDAAKLSITYKNERPVAVADLTASLAALSDEYRRWTETCELGHLPDGLDLYVTGVRTSSIWVELQALAPLALPFVENAATVISFASHLNRVVKSILGGGKETAEVNSKALENVSRFVEPVAKDNGSQIMVAGPVKGDLKIQNIYVQLSSLEANAVQNQVRKALDLRKAPATGAHNQVVLYLHQARNDPSSSAGDRGIIESIYPGPVKLIFASEGLKQAAISRSENFFRYAFIVDVQVETVGGRPVLYKVTQVHEAIERPTEGEAA